MATSRDDFVIAIRSAFLKKANKQRFSLIGLIFFSIALILFSKINLPFVNYLNIGLNEIVYRSSFIISFPEKKILQFKDIIKNHYILYDNYNEIKNELEQLKSEKLEIIFLKEENMRLKKTIDEYIYNSEELVAKVLIDKDSPFLKSIIVNKGSKDSVKLGMAVLDGNYLVGKIVEVNYSTSRALIISDLNSKIPVSIEPGNIQSILSGTGKGHGKIEYVESEILIDDGSIVYTSGSGNIFKSGIPIGIFNKNENISEEVKFFSKLSQLTFVKLVSFEGSKN